MAILTILQSQPTSADQPCPRLTKTFTASGVKSYDSALYFRATPAEIDNIVELSELLTMLEEMDDACLIRGHIIEGTDTSFMRRLKDPSTDSAGNTIAATIAEVAQNFFLADFDKVPAPSADMTHQQRLDFLISLLPVWFHSASYHFRWSASAGINGFDTLSCHLWFWLSEPWSSEVLRERIRTEDGWEDIDTAPFSANQVHYTAAPIFEADSEITDPFVGQLRSGLVRKSSDVVNMPMFIKPIPSPAIIQHRKSQNSGDRFRDLLAEIGPNFHEPIRHAIAFYVRTNSDPDTTALKEMIRDAIYAAPSGKNPKANYLSDHYLDRLITGALRKFS